MDDELTALERSFLALGVYSEDCGERAIEKFGSFGSLFKGASDIDRRSCFDEVLGFIRCGNAVVLAAVKERAAEIVPKSRYEASQYAAATMFENGGECLLALDDRCRVERVLRLSRGGLRNAVGRALNAFSYRFIWLRRVDDKDTARAFRRRMKKARRTAYMLKKIGVEAVDYIECRRGRMYSALSKRYVDMNYFDKKPYPLFARNNRIEVIKNGRAIRHGRNVSSDGSGQLYAGVLQGTVR